MSLQILILKLDGITAGDYLTWCRDPDPPALDYGLRSVHGLATTAGPLRGHGDRSYPRQLDGDRGGLSPLATVGR